MTTLAHTTTATVSSSSGEIEIDNTTGNVIRFIAVSEPDGPDQFDIRDITRFDLAEYRQYYGPKSEQDTSYDILDLGYWFMGEGNMLGYEEPAHDWRQMMHKMDAEAVLES